MQAWRIARGASRSAARLQSGSGRQRCCAPRPSTRRTEDELQKIKDPCQKLDLKNTFILGARGQGILVELYTVSNVGCFPSFKELFGLVFVECVACMTPTSMARAKDKKVRQT